MLCLYTADRYGTRGSATTEGAEGEVDQRRGDHPPILKNLPASFDAFSGMLHAEPPNRCQIGRKNPMTEACEGKRAFGVDTPYVMLRPWGQGKSLAILLWKGQTPM